MISKIAEVYLCRWRPVRLQPVVVVPEHTVLRHLMHAHVSVTIVVVVVPTVHGHLRIRNLITKGTQRINILNYALTNLLHMHVCLLLLLHVLLLSGGHLLLNVLLHGLDGRHSCIVVERHGVLSSGCSRLSRH